MRLEDGTWSHENGSDEWERSQIGTGSPGGVIVLSEGGTKYVRLQETGDPRNHGMDDPSNRKLYFGHSITNDIGATGDTILDDGVTISFRARIATRHRRAIAVVVFIKSCGILRHILNSIELPAL